MTIIRHRFLRPSLEGDVPYSLELRFRPSGARVVAGDPKGVVLPAAFTEVMPGGVLNVDLAHTGPGWCWEIYRPRGEASALREWVVVPEPVADPDVPGEFLPVDYPDLIRVDPATLEPTAEPEPAWWAGVDEMKAAALESAVLAAAAAAAATSAVTSATEAEQEALAASAAAGVIIEMTETGRLSETALSDTIGESPALPGRAEWPMNFPVYDGNPNVAHPDVVYIPGGFGEPSHRYWMAYTPYPSDVRENPSIASSPDGVIWSLPPGAPNPVVPYSETSAQGYTYNSDTSLIMLEDGRMAMYYRQVNNNTGVFRIALKRKTTTNGAVWSDAQTIVDITYSGTVGDTEGQYMSPTFVREDNGNIRMWYVSNSGDGLHEVYVRTSIDDGLTFGAATQCVTGMPSRNWHVDVEKVGSEYWLLLNRRIEWDLQLFKSDDGISWQPVRLIPKTGTGIDSWGNYRASLVPSLSASGLSFDIYASVVKSESPLTGPPTGIDDEWRIILLRGVPAGESGYLSGGIVDDRDSVAAGFKSKTTGSLMSVAVGAGAKVVDDTGYGRGVAVGEGSIAGRTAVSVGRASNSAINGVAIGNNALAGGGGTAVGSDSASGPSSCLAVGREAKSLEVWGTAVGTGAKAGYKATSLGYQADANLLNGVAVGVQAAVKANGGGVAVGNETTVEVSGGVALGYLAKVGTGHTNSTALGSNTATTAQNQVAIGPRSQLALNVAAEPATPVGGGVIFVQDGALKYKGSSGTVTVIAPA